MFTDIGVVIAILREVGYDTHENESRQTLEIKLQQFVFWAARINQLHHSRFLLELRHFLLLRQYASLRTPMLLLLCINY